LHNGIEGPLMTHVAQTPRCVLQRWLRGQWLRPTALIRRAMASRGGAAPGPGTLSGAPARSGERSPTLGTILVVTTLRHRGAVGAQTHISQADRLLRGHGWCVEVVSLDSWTPVLGPILLAPSLLIRRLRIRWAVRIDRALVQRSVEVSLRRRLTHERPALVYAQNPRSAAAALTARRATGVAVPVVMVVHYNESEAEELVQRGVIARGGRADRAMRRFEADLLPRLDGLVFVSEFMARHVLAEIPAAAAVPRAIVPNFLFRNDLGVATEPRRDCISVGSLLERKNHQYLLRVIAAAGRRGHRYTLTIVGDGDQRPALERLASTLGIVDQVTFLGERFDVDRLLLDHRVYVHSALMENCPFVLIEAFRAGLPVVTSSVGGIPEVVGDDGSGRFWDLFDPEEGARVLTRLLEDDQELSRSAARAAARFEARFDADVVGATLTRFLTQVQSTEPRSRG
jgi:glycosyltransferase involved in cell wall biosynthesis